MERYLTRSQAMQLMLELAESCSAMPRSLLADLLAVVQSRTMDPAAVVADLVATLSHGGQTLRATRDDGP
jgi:hypothetical protein